MEQRRNIILVVVISVAVLLSAGIYLAINNRSNGITRSSIRNISHDGIDVSHHQGKLDWNSIGKDSNIQFAYIKATEGTSWSDKRFRENARKAKKNRIKVGAYHVLSLTSSPETQVENFCRMVNKNTTDLIPAIDIEEKLLKSKQRDLIKQYALRVSELLEKRFGKKPLIYTSESVFNDYLYPEFSNYYLWIASYGRHCPLLKGKTRTNIWQYTERGRISGCKKYLDLSCFVNGMTIDKLEL